MTGESANILIIDDEAVMHALFKEALDGCGYSLRFAFSAEEGLEMLRSGPCDLIFSDIVLPGMKGPELLKVVKQINGEIEIVMMTSHGSVDLAVSAMKDGAHHFMQKPLDIRQIRALIEKVVEKNRLKTALSVYEAGQSIFKNLNLEALLPITVHLAAEALGSDDASLMLLNQENFLEVAAIHGPPDDERWKARVAMGDRVAGRVAWEKKSALISGSVEKYPRFVGTAGQPSILSSIVYPLMIDEMVLGVLNINRKTNHEPFNAADLRLAGILCSQIGQAVYNARLFASLRNEKARLSAVFEHMTDAVILTDERGKILVFNGAARKLFHKEIRMGDNLMQESADIQIQPSLSAIMAAAEPVAHFKAAREQPKRTVFSGTSSLLKLEALGFQSGGNGRLFILRDITDEDREAISKRSFLSLVSHKLRTPLAAIIGYCDILLREPDVYLKPPAVPPINTAFKHALKLTELVRKLLDFVALEDVRARGVARKAFGFAASSSSVVDSMKPWLESQKVNVRFLTQPGKEIAAYGEETLIQDVLRSLIENAVKFNPKPEKLVLIGAELRENGILIYVQDNGSGISVEEREKIFSQFYQVDPDFTGQIDGWGLGLAFAKKAVECHGGTLNLESKLGEGTRVSFLLPKGL